jgi:hypothetical protein
MACIRSAFSFARQVRVVAEQAASVLQRQIADLSIDPRLVDRDLVMLVT